jgi:CheY-like chemotaxis protein
MARPLHILVVDDDAENAAALAELFESDNHRVIIAYDGQQAVDAYAAQDFDLGFFDMMMPVKNGVESFLEIRQTRPDAKVYFLTGFAESKLIETACRSGAMGVFGKPADPAKILDVVDQEAA